MFPIHFRFSNYKDKSEQLIRDSAESLAVPDAAISSVVVANDSEQDYGATIQQCRGYNHSGTHSSGGAGKTVPFRNGDRSVQSEVVYPSSTLTALFCYSHESPTYLLRRYAIHHEFGHVIDYHTRSALFPAPLLGNERTIADFASYFGSIILSEFAACFISGVVVSNSQYEEIAANTRVSIEDVVGHGAHFGNQLPWCILSQEAQVAGTAMGFKGGSKATFVRWHGASEDSMHELALFSDELLGFKGKYPAWENAACIAQVTDRCESFARTLQG